MSATPQNSMVPASKSSDPADPIPTEKASSAQASQSISKARQILLGVNVAIAALVLGRALLDPTIGKPRSVELPETVELAQWTLIDSEELEPFTLITGEADHSEEGQRYTYALAVPGSTNQDTQATLTIEMRYMIDTNGFIERLLMGHKEFQNTLASLEEKGIDTSTVEADVQYQSGVGYSGHFQFEETTYLSACINPRGESTFFIDQFLNNQSIYDRDPTRLFSVLLGRQVWTDQRCLWTHMALSPSSSGTQSTVVDEPIDLQSLLDETWAEWHSIWQPQFPQR